MQGEGLGVMLGEGERRGQWEVTRGIIRTDMS